MSTYAVLTEADKVDLRRFAGYSPYADRLDAGLVMGRDDQLYLEWRLNHLPEEVAEVLALYLGQLRAVEVEIFRARDRLKTASISIIERNPTEMRDRRAEAIQLRLDLCELLGVEPGEALSGPVTRVVI